jgi:hypothetical protein
VPLDFRIQADDSLGVIVGTHTHHRKPHRYGSSTETTLSSAPHSETGANVAWLTIRRTSEDDVRERELYVSLDGERLGILVYGDTATVALSPGRHEVRVHNTLSRKKADFNAVPGQHVRFRASNVPGKGVAYWAFFVGAALMWTVLEREDDGPAGMPPAIHPFRY